MSQADRQVNRQVNRQTGVSGRQTGEQTDRWTVLPDVGDGVVHQLQRRNQKVFVEVFSGEDLRGCLTDVEEPQSVPVAPTLSQI